MGTGPFPVVKRLRRGVDRHPYSAEVKETSTPPLDLHDMF
jgi:hypothetical protein